MRTRIHVVGAALLCLLALGFPAPCHGNEARKWKKTWMASVAVLAASNVADVHSSRGIWEANPLLRDRSGRFSPGKAVAIKSAASGGLILLEYVLLKRSPGEQPHKPFAVTNFIAAGAVTGAAVRNYGLPRARPPDYLWPD